MWPETGSRQAITPHAGSTPNDLQRPARIRLDKRIDIRQDVEHAGVMPGRSAESIRNHRAGQQRIRRRCKCGRIITGNAAWWSHTTMSVWNGKALERVPRPGCGYDGRA